VVVAAMKKCRLRQLAFVSALSLVGAGSMLAIPPGSAAGASSPVSGEVTAALHHLVGSPAGTQALAPYVQGMDPAMAKVLAAGASQPRANSSYLLSDGTVTAVTDVEQASAVATFDFYISNSSSRGYSEGFFGTAVPSAGRWKLSWVTACMLVEQEGVVCPDPPAGVEATVPLPYSVTDEEFLARQTPGLIRPDALAIGPRGDLLIEDTSRDEVLSLSPTGVLSSFAGNGVEGFAGDGGPASSAEIGVQGGGGLAVAPDGTTYIADGGNCRIRAVSTQGVITTFAHNPDLCNVASIAVSAKGAVFVATPVYVEEVSPNGALTRVAGAQGSTTSDHPGVSPSNIVFGPGSLAFDGAGNLDIWSWEPRTIYQLSPRGTIRALAGFIYATQLATGPDGTVLFGSHGGGLYEVTPSGVKLYNALAPEKISGLSWPRLTAFQADGLAAAPSGEVFADNSAGNGYGDGNALIELNPQGRARVVAVRSVGGAFPALGGPGFPAQVYPPARPASGGDLASCPSSAGLEPFDAPATEAAKALAANYNLDDMLDLRATDLSWWEGDFDLLDSQAGTGNTTVVSVRPASRDTFAAAVSASCGAQLVRDSLVVDLGPSGESFAVGHLYFLDRLGHPLVYFEAS
jgi:hypothetical protein